MNDTFVSAVTKFYKSNEVKTVSSVRRSSTVWLNTRLIICKDMDYEAEAPVISKALTYGNIEPRKVVGQIEAQKWAGRKERGRPKKFDREEYYFDGVSFNSYSCVKPIDKHPFRVAVSEGKKVDVLPRSQFLIVSQKSFNMFPFVVIDGEKDLSMTPDQFNILSASMDTDLVGILSEMYQNEWFNATQANNPELWRPKQKTTIPVDLPTRWLKYYVSQIPPSAAVHKATVDELRISFGDYVTNANGSVMDDPPFLNVVKFGRYLERMKREKGYPLTKCRVIRRNRDCMGYKFDPRELSYFLNKPTSTT